MTSSVHMRLTGSLLVLLVCAPALARAQSLDVPALRAEISPRSIDFGAVKAQGLHKKTFIIENLEKRKAAERRRDDFNARLRRVLAEEGSDTVSVKAETLPD